MVPFLEISTSLIGSFFWGGPVFKGCFFLFFFVFKRCYDSGFREGWKQVPFLKMNRFTYCKAWFGNPQTISMSQNYTDNNQFFSFDWKLKSIGSCGAIFKRNQGGHNPWMSWTLIAEGLFWYDLCGHACHSCLCALAGLLESSWSQAPLCDPLSQRAHQVAMTKNSREWSRF